MAWPRAMGIWLTGSAGGKGGGWGRKKDTQESGRIEESPQNRREGWGAGPSPILFSNFSSCHTLARRSLAMNEAPAATERACMRRFGRALLAL